MQQLIIGAIKILCLQYINSNRKVREKLKCMELQWENNKNRNFSKIGSENETTV